MQTNRFKRFGYTDKYHVRPEYTDTDASNVSLEAAIDSLIPIFGELPKAVKQAELSLHQVSKNRLNVDESIVLYLYTSDYNDAHLNKLLNESLESGDESKIQPWRNFLHILYSALNKLPVLKKQIWLALPVAIGDQLTSGQELTLTTIISCSASEDYIKRILHSQETLCCITQYSGRAVSDYAAKKVDEVLLLPGTRLCVSKELGNGRKNKRLIHLKEITDPILAVAENESEKDLHRMEIMFSDGAGYLKTYQADKKENGTYYDIDGNEIQNLKIPLETIEGDGMCRFENGDCFIGHFERGVRQGFGILVKKQGEIEYGEWKDDELIKKDNKILENEEKYTFACKKDGKRSFGCHQDENGNKYIGSIVNNEADGFGVRIWSDNHRYEGYFKNGKKNGYGIYYYGDNGKYIGLWNEDEINGRGHLSWSTGTCYKGEFLNGKMHGKGTAFFTNGEKLEGEWRDDEFVI